MALRNLDAVAQLLGQDPTRLRAWEMCNLYMGVYMDIYVYIYVFIDTDR